MFCKKCGQQLREGATFCPGCGNQVGTGANYSIPAPTPQPVPQPEPKPAPPVSAPKKGRTGLIITIIILAAIILLGAGGFILYQTNPEIFPWYEEETMVEKDKDKGDEKDKEEAEKPDITGIVNTLISSQGVDGNVSVAVVDNRTGEEYLCSYAGVRYASWGFYLPAYMALCDMYPDSYDTYKDDILSHDAGRCNSAANFAIDVCGGTTAITNHISSNMGYSLTCFGRKFGQTNAGGENYTTAGEAARMLYEFNQNDDYTKLCYNPANYGVLTPANANVYAQIGTENINEMKNLNVFAIVKGNNSDYSIAILSQGGACQNGIVDSVLEAVHTEMERVSQ